MSKVYMEGKNFLLVLERTNRKGLLSGPCVIRSSGYTSTIKAVKEPWIWTQVKTLPKEDRSHASDPVIALQRSTLSVYEEEDCNVFNLYLRPECKGLKYAMEELAELLEREFFKRYEKHALIGHSKGGLLMGGLAKYLDTRTNIAMITPTFGTIMGNEQMVFEVLDTYLDSQSRFKQIVLTPEIEMYKWVTHTVGSRRPVDYDMAIGSTFLREDLDLSRLSNHHTVLITAQCPERYCSPSEAIFRHYGKYVGLDKEADGMVTMKKQMLASQFVDEVVNMDATHPTVLKKAGPIIAAFLHEVFA